MLLATRIFVHHAFLERLVITKAQKDMHISLGAVRASDSALRFTSVQGHPVRFLLHASSRPVRVCASQSRGQRRFSARPRRRRRRRRNRRRRWRR